MIDGNTFNISSDGVYLDIDLDYDATLTGYNVTIGDIDILDNVFNMVTTDGVEIDDIWVQELNGGSISMGDVNISGNEFYGGSKGIDFFGDFDDLTNTTVTVGDVVINDNTFVNQTNDAMAIDYYNADHWYGTTTGTYGDLVINGNTITSVTTDAIHIGYAYFKYFEDDASLTVGNLYIESNEINVSGEGIYYYYYIEYLYNDTTVTMGEVSIKNNTIVSRNDYGIYLRYDDFGENMYGNATVTTGEVHIGGTGTGEGNTIYADYEAIYVYYDAYVASYMEDNATLIMGDIYVQNNDISGDDDGIYLEYEDDYVGYEIDDNAYAELPDYVITGNTFNVTGNGIELYTYDNPYDIYDNATFDFGGAFIDDNTFSCEHGIYFYYVCFCYGNYDNSATIIGDVTITNNRFYDLDYEAIYIYYYDIGNFLYDYSTLDVGDLVIADNTVDVAGSDGIRVDYDYVESDDNGTTTMGNLDVTGNDVRNVTADGIHVHYDLRAHANSTLTIGRALIQDNTLDGSSDDGVYVYMLKDRETGATITLGDPIIDDNIIENWVTGIKLEDVENATITRNMIVNNTGGATGVHLPGGSNYNEIHTNCFYNNTPQAMDNGTGNNWDGNYWSDYIGSGPYNISGTANSTDDSPLDVCPLGQEPPAPAQVPALTPIGMIALIGILSVVLAVATLRRKRE